MKKRTLFLAGTLVLLLVINVSAIQAETNRVLINEFVTDPKTDWDANSQVGSSDEWFELHNPQSSSIIIDNWYLKFIDSSIETQSLSGTIPAGGYFTILDQVGTQGDNGRIELYDNLNNLIDSVSFGDYDDGNLNDNAPVGTSTNQYDECLGRYPNAVDTGIDADDFVKNLCTFNGLNNASFTPVTITLLAPQPSCILDSDDVLIQAEITGSIAQVILKLNADGTVEEIAIQGNSQGIYSYTLDSSKTSPSANLQWQFVVEDTRGDEISSEINSSQVYSITSLQVFPSSPNGKNNWYITEPQFELSNSDATQIDFRWNGLFYVYSLPFKLEGTPNNGNITGGTHVLHYSSDVCNEAEKQFSAKFDFMNPKIEDMEPAPNSKIFNDQEIIVSAHIDEIYQGNSGVNLSSIKMKIDGASVPIFAEPMGSLDAEVAFQGSLSNGNHEATLYVEDFSGRNSSTTWSFTLLPQVPLEMSINMPTNSTYRERRIQFNVSLTRNVEELFFINSNDPNPIFKRLCKNCNGFGQDKAIFRSLREGENNLIFRAENNGQVLEKSVLLVIDSQNPKIFNVLPKSGLASGVFEIEFHEDNPASLEINFGNEEIGFQNSKINISKDCQKNGFYSCISQVDLSDYDGSSIEYYISIKDLAGNIEQSSVRTVYVDDSNPKIDSFELDISGKFATFILEVNEPYLDKIVYIDYSEEDAKEKTLCTKLVEGICQKKVTFNDGLHNISVIVRDKARNEAKVFSNFVTDSKVPKIKSTLPTKGFSSGEFTLNYEETSPASAYLIYGTITKRRFQELNLSTCVPEKKNIVCTIATNLSEFDGTDISYWFNITDSVDNFAESKPITLKVDSTPPQIFDFDFEVNDRDVSFIIGIVDSNFDEVMYLDREETNPKFRTLCSKLQNGICEQTKRFSQGSHVLEIVAKDKAGNEATVFSGLSFSI